MKEIEQFLRGNSEFSSEEQGNSSELLFHSSEVSFHSSELLFRRSVGNFHFLGGDLRFPRERLLSTEMKE